MDQHTKELTRRVTCIVGFGGVGKTAIATALYRAFKEKFAHSAVVTVSQSSDVEASNQQLLGGRHGRRRERRAGPRHHGHVGRSGQVLQRWHIKGKE